MVINLSGGVSSNFIDNDSYIIITWGEDSDNVKILKYDDKKAQDIDNSLTFVSLNKNLMQGKIGGALKATARFISSKALSPAVQGRVESGLIGILNDGKIKLNEVKASLIDNCTNELDKVAVDLGFPTPSALYDAISNNGSGLNPDDFIQSYTNATKSTANDIISSENNAKEGANVLKLRFCESDSETYKSEIPSRRTEKGFAYTDYVFNDSLERSFGVVLGGVASNPFEYKDVLKSIRDSKIPFDVYINDPKNKNQEILTNCLFSNLSFDRSTDLGDSISCAFDIKEIIESEIKTEKVSGSTSGKSVKSRKQKPSTKKIDKNISNKTKNSGPKKFSRSISGQFADQQVTLLESQLGRNNAVVKALKSAKR